MFYGNPLSSTYNGDGIFDTFEGLSSNGDTARNTFKVGMFCCFPFTARTVAQRCLEQVGLGGNASFLSFQVGTKSQSPPLFKVSLLILTPIVGCLLFAQGSHPAGRLLHVNVVVYLTYLHARVQFFRTAAVQEKYMVGNDENL